MSVATALDNSYYKEYQGLNHLSKTFQSSLAFSPSDVSRRTASQGNFSRQREQEERVIKTSWGRKYSYGGLGSLNLPEEHRPKSEPPTRVQKGHRHFTAGTTIDSRNVKTAQQYSRTALKRSDVRVTDELIEAPTKVDVARHVIKLGFPAEHPHASHVSRTSLFPSYDLSTKQGVSIGELPATAPHVLITSKTKGSFGRHEKSSALSDRTHRTLKWHDGPNFFQMTKTLGVEKMEYYPTPIKSLDANLTSSRNLSEATIKDLMQIRKSQWQSTYHKDISQNHGQSSSLDNRRYICLPNGSNDVKKTQISDNEDPRRELNVSCGTSSGNYDANPDSCINITKGSNEFSEELKAETLPIANGRKITDKQHSNVNLSILKKSNDQAIDRNILSNPDFSEKMNRGLTRNSEELSRGWSRTDIRRRFNEKHQDELADLRRKPDLRITTNERRHRFPEYNGVSSYVLNGQSIPNFKGKYFY